MMKIQRIQIILIKKRNKDQVKLDEFDNDDDDISEIMDLDKIKKTENKDNAKKNSIISIRVVSLV
jgi:hypothetical protein